MGPVAARDQAQMRRSDARVDCQIPLRLRGRPLVKGWGGVGRRLSVESSSDVATTLFSGTGLSEERTWATELPPSNEVPQPDSSEVATMSNRNANITIPAVWKDFMAGAFSGVLVVAACGEGAIESNRSSRRSNSGTTTIRTHMRPTAR